MTLIYLLRANSFTAYFSTPAIFITSFFFTRVWSATSGEPSLAKPTFIKTYFLPLFFFAFLFGFGYQGSLREVDSKFEISEKFEERLWSILTGSGHFWISAVVLFLVSIVSKKSTRLLAASLFVVTLALTAGTNTNQFRVWAKYGPSYFMLQSPETKFKTFGSDDLHVMTDFLRTNTEVNLIFASNNFCCAGANWWIKVLDSPDYSETTDIFDYKRYGGHDLLLPIESRRRFLIQGLKFATVSATPEQINRMSLSLEFANTPSASSLRRLKAYGVSGYVVNLSLTEHRDWSEFAIERFRSGNFVYLELR